MRNWIRVLLSAILLVSLMACQGSFLAGKPLVIPKKQRIPLPVAATPREGTWKAPELRIQYQLQAEPDGTVLLSGELFFESWVTTGFATVQRFYLKALFVDDSGNILGSQGIYVIANRQESDQLMRFDRRLAVTPGATALSFRYDGTMMDVIKDNQAGWNFWYP